ncbi:MAG: hypothetical protein HY292_02760 [Planctomycetes bacterium]|nr:hypothetical protein [Planctomycetota bacterium]
MDSRNAIMGLGVWGWAAFGWEARERLMPVEPLLTGPAVVEPPYPFRKPDEGHHETHPAFLKSLTRDYSFTTTATINTFPTVRLQTSPPFALMVDLAITRALPTSWSPRTFGLVPSVAFGVPISTVPTLSSTQWMSRLHL